MRGQLQGHDDVAITDLVDVWGHDSRDRLGISRQQWHHPAVRELLDALEAGDNLEGPLRSLGEARGAAGLSLEETLEDLRALVRLLPDRTGGRLDGLDAAGVVGSAWAEAFLASVVKPGCVDSLTGLSSREFLEARLEQLYRHCSHLGLAPHAAYAVIVVDAEPDSISPFSRLARRLRLAGDLRAAFPGGDTLAVVGEHLFVAVVACSPELDDTVEELRATAEPARVTVVELPDAVAEVLELVADLAVGA
jgi:hypothetical protein